MARLGLFVLLVALTLCFASISAHAIRQDDPEPIETPIPLTELPCFRNMFEPQLDLRMLSFELLETRAKLQEKVALLERFYHEVESGNVLSRTCLGFLRQFYKSPHNMENLRECTNFYTQRLPSA